MRPIFSAPAALLLAGTVLSSAAWAQAAVTPRQEQAGLPAGPYLLSCAHPHRVNGRLVAFCDDQTNALHGQDTWHTAQLSNAQQCSGSVDNVNGRLTCGTAPMVGSSTPPQSYGSAFGTSGYPRTPGSPYTSYPGNYEFNSPPGYPMGQPVPPANKPYYSRPY